MGIGKAFRFRSTYFYLLTIYHPYLYTYITPHLSPLLPIPPTDTV